MEKLKAFINPKREGRTLYHIIQILFLFLSLQMILEITGHVYIEKEYSLSLVGLAMAYVGASLASTLAKLKFIPRVLFRVENNSDYYQIRLFNSSEIPELIYGVFIVNQSTIVLHETEHEPRTLQPYSSLIFRLPNDLQGKVERVEISTFKGRLKGERADELWRPEVLKQ